MGLARRRWLMQAGAAAVLVIGGLRPACAGMGISGYTVSLAELLAMLSERFPRRFPLAGLAALELNAPHNAAARANRCARGCPPYSAGPVGMPREGVLEVEFGLRYEAKDRTLRAHDIVFHSLEMQGLEPAAAALLHAWAPRLARRALGEVVLHRLEEKDLALLDGLGLQPGAIAVTDQGLSIAFVRRGLNTLN
jgi:hypothetical protein